MNLDLLRQLCETPGVPGNEAPIRFVISSQIPESFSTSTDAIGNLYVHQKKGSLKVLVTAHMDEIGLITTHIDSKGFIRFHTLGGFDTHSLVNQRVIIHGKQSISGVIGSKAIHMQSEADRKKKATFDQLFIDTGLPVEEVEASVEIGSVITRERPLTKQGNSIVSKALDNRVSVFVLLETLNRLSNHQLDLTFAFTTQEEVGLRGARIAASTCSPEIGINLDVTIANDTPGSEDHKMITKLGHGPALKVMDGSVITSVSLSQFIKDKAQSLSIHLQPEILTAGGTDTSALQYLTGVGAETAALSIPTRYLHTPNEMVHLSDVDETIVLLTEILSHLHEYSA